MQINLIESLRVSQLLPDQGSGPGPRPVEQHQGHHSALAESQLECLGIFQDASEELVVSRVAVSVLLDQPLVLVDRYDLGVGAVSGRVGIPVAVAGSRNEDECPSKSVAVTS